MTTDANPKQINWSAVLSGIIGAAAPVLVVYLGDAQAWLQNNAHFAPLAALIPVITGWVAAKGTAKGSLSVKRKPPPPRPVNDEGM